jgi:hypothetical protein
MEDFPPMDDKVKSPTEARQASKEGVGRYVLSISLFLVIVMFIAAYFLFAG